MTNSVVADIEFIRAQLDLSNPEIEAAWAGVESFVAIGLRVFAETNPSKLREAMRLEEIKARMDGREVLG